MQEVAPARYVEPLPSQDHRVAKIVGPLVGGLHGRDSPPQPHRRRRQRSSGATSDSRHYTAPPPPLPPPPGSTRDSHGKLGKRRTVPGTAPLSSTSPAPPSPHTYSSPELGTAQARLSTRPLRFNRGTLRLPPETRPEGPELGGPFRGRQPSALGPPSVVARDSTTRLRPGRTSREPNLRI